MVRNRKWTIFSRILSFLIFCPLQFILRFLQTLLTEALTYTWCNNPLELAKREICQEQGDLLVMATHYKISGMQRLIFIHIQLLNIILTTIPPYSSTCDFPAIFANLWQFVSLFLPAACGMVIRWVTKGVVVLGPLAFLKPPLPLIQSGSQYILLSLLTTLPNSTIKRLLCLFDDSWKLSVLLTTV